MNIFNLGTGRINKVWNNIFSRFLAGDLTEKMRLLYAVMDVYGFPSMKSEKEAASKAIAEFVSGLKMKEYFHLENEYRWWNYEWEPEKAKSKDWSIDNVLPSIKQIRKEDERRAVLILGCMSADGFLRQKCLNELAGYTNSLPFLLIRLNDWVKEIRGDAYKLSIQRINVSDARELLMALPVLEKLKNTYRKERDDCERISEIYYGKLMESVGQISFDKIGMFDQAVQNAFYRLINHFNILDKDRLIALLEATTGNFESGMVIHALIKYYDMSEADFHYYLQNKNGIIRRYVIEKWTKQNGLWDGAEIYLLDRSKSVRLVVQYLIQKYTDVNVVDYYLEQLKTSKFKIAIEGLGETADESVLPVLLPYLDDSDWVVRRKALRAIGSLLKENGEEYYLRFLWSENIALVKTAYLQCRKWDIYMNAETLVKMYEAFEDEQRKCYCLLLLRKRPFWDCVTIYLGLYGRVSEKQQAIINDILKVRPIYQRISLEKGNDIKLALEQNKSYLPEQLYKNILFDVEHVMK